jgi:hypothetical protein
MFSFTLNFKVLKGKFINLQAARKKGERRKGEWGQGRNGDRKKQGMGEMGIEKMQNAKRET